MAATYDEAGNYVYPDGFDADTGEWLEGFDSQREAWEKQYEDAQKRFRAHQEQIARMAAQDAEAALPQSYTSATDGEDDAEVADTDAPSRPAPSAPASTGGAGTLASDEALQALREKLAGGS